MPNSPFGFEGRVILDRKFIINPQMEWTGGGFASTPEDLARWAKLLYEGKVLKKETLDQMLTGGEGRAWQRRGEQVRTSGADQAERVGRELWTRRLVSGIRCGDGIFPAAEDSGRRSVQHRCASHVEERTASLHRRCD